MPLWFNYLVPPQYSIMNAPKTNSNQEQQDWITFFKEGHYMSEKDVKKKIKTSAVLEAFKRSRIKNLPAKVLSDYEEEDKEYDRYGFVGAKVRNAT